MKAAFKYFIIWLGLNIIATFLVIIVGYIVCSIMGHPLPTLEDIMDHSWITLGTLVVTDLLVLLMFWMRKYTRFGFNYGFTYGESFSSKRLYLWAGVGALGLLIFDVMAQYYLPIPEDPEIMETLTQMMKNPLGVLSICLIGPLAEEVVFRGAIERRLLEKNWSPWYAIVISALFFAVAHMNFAQGFTATVIGIFMGWVYYRTRSIWPTVFIHVLNNTTATIVALASPDTMVDETFVPPLSWGIPLLIAGLALILLAARYIGKLTADRTPIPVPVNEVLPPPLPGNGVLPPPFPGNEPVLDTPIEPAEAPEPDESIDDTQNDVL